MSELKTEPEFEELSLFDDPDNPDLSHIIPDLRPLAVRMDTLLLDDENARDHDARSIKVTAGSMKLFTQRTPLTVNRRTNKIEKGNGTFKAAKLLGWTHIAVVWADDDPLNAAAYAHLDNRTSDLSKMNYEQAGKNVRRFKEAEHPVLDLMYTEAEAAPLHHENFQPAQITDEVFDSSMLRGRSITKISASERLLVDKAIKVCREENQKALTEGECLQIFAQIYLGLKGMTDAVSDEEMLNELSEMQETEQETEIDDAEDILSLD